MKVCLGKFSELTKNLTTQLEHFLFDMEIDPRDLSSDSGSNTSDEVSKSDRGLSDYPSWFLTCRGIPSLAASRDNAAASSGFYLDEVG